MSRYRRRRHRIPILACLVFLCAIVLAATKVGGTEEPLVLQAPQPQIETAGETGAQAMAAIPPEDIQEASVELYRTALDKTVTLTMEDYLVGVVAAEVPASFEPEALKAQAIVARTYTLRKINGGATGPGGTAICDNYAYCQAYMDDEQLREKWGDAFTENYQKVKTAVTDTTGKVVLYEGELALTPYHSTCGGKTASAAEVWGTAYPYLVSVDCRWDTDAARYKEDFTFALADMPELLGENGVATVSLTSAQRQREVPKILDKTASGRVSHLSYGGMELEGTAFRSKLGINSTNFTFDVDGGTLIVHTRGYGHGVGLCQYGANGMAKEGKTAAEIIAYYYKGVEIGTAD